MTRYGTISLAFALLASLVAPRAFGQPAAGGLEEVRVDLWPEYDRPDVLVLYKFPLDAARSLEAPVSLPIPASVGEPHAVAWRDANGSLYVAEFTRTVQGDRAMISMRLGSREGQLEFYDRLERDGSKRRYRFQWPGGVAVGSLSVRVQRPRDARDLEVEPAPSREWQGEDGLAYALVELGRQEPDAAPPAVQVGYVKDTSTLSAGDATTPALATSTAPAASAGASETTASLAVPKWGVALAGLLVALAGGWLLWSSRAGAPAAKPEASSRRQAPKTKRSQAVFCHQCGAKAEPGHNFCMSCGAKLVRPK